MMNRKNKLLNKYKRHGYRPEDKIRFENFRDECMLSFENAKERYLNDLGNKLADRNTNQKVYWKIMNKVMNKCKISKIPPILVNNIFIINCKDKAKEFLSFFSNQCKTIVNDSVLPIFRSLTDSRIETVNITNNDIHLLIRSLNPNKANGPDEISARMILICDETIVKPLRIIFDNILLTGIYPDLWKQANLTPIHKKASKQLVKNYRPISLLPIFGKIFEKLVFQQLYSYFHSNNLITKNQSGFRPGDSTTNQLLELVNVIQKSFDTRNSLEVRSIFLDISKAFDKVWHRGLIFKLRQNGVDGPLITFFENYLSNRKQRVVLNGLNSEFHSIDSGVPQGSVLGPLLFLIYINDMEQRIKSSIKFFADDTMLFSLVRDPSISALELNHDLELINKWAHQWKMQFNPESSKQAVQLIFSQKLHKPIHPTLYFNGLW